MSTTKRHSDTTTAVYGSEEMVRPAPTMTLPEDMTPPEIAYRMVKDETYAQTQPRLNLATFVTTYMDEYATRLMNESVAMNYIDQTEYPRVAVMASRCINILANLWQLQTQDRRLMALLMLTGMRRGEALGLQWSDIDWEKVRASGVEYAMIRLGYRGMNEGTLELDPYYFDNVKEATIYKDIDTLSNMEKKALII